MTIRVRFTEAWPGGPPPIFHDVPVTLPALPRRGDSVLIWDRVMYVAGIRWMLDDGEVLIRVQDHQPRA